ncbi:phospholipase A2 isoform X2 [Oncorhynchus mykiss]|uniref:phospholipase A2 isoform X2 n=1 Tax=Oncorhynchus mykiss TaxID=8022 RepID=UPI000B4FCF6E|nr:phospholipase A2 isoform X2 [Oncorhynchus mykiss]XP_036791644.1 phospholipase A2 isoform X2 [Oncorhynchus mykiss]
MVHHIGSKEEVMQEWSMMTHRRSSAFTKAVHLYGSIPWCCEVHDHCYQASRHLPDCRTVIDYPYINLYRFSCANGQVSCSASSHVCQVSVCECDRVATNCFAKSTYNPKNKNLDPKVHCLS